eukprot:GFYU01003347.1.p1 GENE.GFYU01003347.1~~GFYU01003347.1.p1  ORF type:complete len:129 (+),score=23.95 GFYU01003347.1:90-476(+)
MTDVAPSDILFVVTKGAEDAENATVPLSLADIAASQHGKTVEVILFNNGATLALPGVADQIVAGAPWEGHAGTRLQTCINNPKITVNVCMPCLIHRGKQNEPLIEGIQGIKGPVFLQKTYAAAKVLQF